MKILMVDVPVVCFGLRSLLEDEHTVAFAHSLEAALEELGRYTFDVVLADIRIAQEEAFLVVRNIRERYPSQKLVLFTTSDGPMQQAYARELGVTAVISKMTGGKALREELARLAT